MALVAWCMQTKATTANIILPFTLCKLCVVHHFVFHIFASRRSISCSTSWYDNLLLYLLALFDFLSTLGLLLLSCLILSFLKFFAQLSLIRHVLGRIEDLVRGGDVRTKVRLHCLSVIDI